MDREQQNWKVLLPDEVRRMLPHRWPIAFINDRVQVDVENKKVQTARPFGFLWWLFCKLCHFRERPVLPGIILIETCAQLCAVLAIELFGNENKGLTIFNSVKAKFSRPVEPPTNMLYFVSTLNKHKRGILFFDCKVMDYEGKVLAELEIIGTSMPAELTNEKAVQKPLKEIPET